MFVSATPRLLLTVLMLVGPLVGESSPAYANKRGSKLLNGLAIGVIGGAVLNEALKAERDRRRRDVTRYGAGAGTATEMRALSDDDRADIERIRTIQAALNAAGYRVGKVDGLWGAGARDAARNFQSSIGSEPSGQLSSSDLKQLEIRSRLSLRSAIAFAQTREHGEIQTLSADDSEDTIVSAQIQLRDAGLYSGEIDGVWGPDARRASIAAGGIVVTEAEPSGEQLVGLANSPNPPATGEPGSDDPGTLPPSVEGNPLSAESLAILEPLLLENGTIATSSVHRELGADFLQAQEKLRLLLALSANEDILKDSNVAQLFARRFLTSESDASYRTPQYPTAERGAWKWSGADEFEQKDSHQRFIEQEAPKFRKLIPTFPLMLVELRPVVVRNYKPDLGGFEIEVDNEMYLSGNQVELPRLAIQPTLWPLSENEARRVREMLRNSVRPWRRRDAYLNKVEQTSATLVRSLVIKSSRWDEKRGVAILDADVVAANMHAGSPYDAPGFPDDNRVRPSVGPLLGTLKVPDLVQSRSPGGELKISTTPNETFLYDRELPRLFAAKLDADNLLQSDFWEETAQVRRNIERKVAKGEDAYDTLARSSWASHFGSAIIGTDVNLSELELSEFKDWTLKRIAQLPTTVRVEPRGLGGFARNGTWVVDLKGVLRQLDSGKAAGNYDQMKAMASEAFPNTYEIFGTDAGKGLAAAFVLRQSPWWEKFEFKGLPQLGDDQRIDGFSEFAIHNVKLAKLPDGVPYIMLEVEPLRAVATSGATPVIMALSQPGSASSRLVAPGAAPLSNLDVLGVRLGQPAEDAEKTLDNEFGGPTARKYRKSHKSSEELTAAVGRLTIQEKDKQLLHAIIRSRGSRPHDIFSNGLLYERLESGNVVDWVVVFFRQSDRGESVVVAAVRQAALDLNSPNARKALKTQLAQKYGTPDYEPGERSTAWVERPASKAKLRADSRFSDVCIPYIPRLVESRKSRSASISVSPEEVDAFHLRNRLDAAPAADRELSKEIKAGLSRWSPVADGFEGTDTPLIRYHEIRVPCGSVLSAWLSDNELTIYLVDTDNVIAERKKPQAPADETGGTGQDGQSDVPAIKL